MTDNDGQNVNLGWIVTKSWQNPGDSIHLSAKYIFPKNKKYEFRCGEFHGIIHITINIEHNSDRETWTGA